MSIVAQDFIVYSIDADLRSPSALCGFVLHWQLLAMDSSISGM